MLPCPVEAIFNPQTPDYLDWALDCCLALDRPFLCSLSSIPETNQSEEVSIPLMMTIIPAERLLLPCPHQMSDILDTKSSLNWAWFYHALWESAIWIKGLQLYKLLLLSTYTFPTTSLLPLNYYRRDLQAINYPFSQHWKLEETQQSGTGRPRLSKRPVFSQWPSTRINWPSMGEMIWYILHKIA